MDGLLDDRRMTRFLGDGFIVLQPAELDPGFHSRNGSAVHMEAHVD